MIEFPCCDGLLSFLPTLRIQGSVEYGQYRYFPSLFVNGKMNHERKFLQWKAMYVLVANLEEWIGPEFGKRGFYLGVELSTETWLLLIVPVNGVLDITMCILLNFDLEGHA